MPSFILTAIVIPTILVSDHSVMLTYTNSGLMGASVAVLTSYWTKNLLWTIVLEMLAFFGWCK
ncbi:AzlD domain-containing protein [Phormidesmis sp. 146-12]